VKETVALLEKVVKIEEQTIAENLLYNPNLPPYIGNS
jgi:hypothetical protein